MPPKRNSKLKKNTERDQKLKKKTGTKKQLSSIPTRLMEISLKVDDYVYKDKPISSKNAALFIKEVTGYKDKCIGDKRSLQVIEKLERCMKRIIEEQQELQGCRENVTNRSNDNSINRDTGNQKDIVIDKPTQCNTSYNEDAKDDLSWIENLRYVREISEEEVIAVYYQESFWESYTLPDDWNNYESF